MDYSDIIDHPDYEEIVSKVVTGVSAKDICQWLKVKYPDKEQKSLHLSQKRLQEFVNGHSNLMDVLKKDIVKIQKGEKVDNKLAESLMNNKTVKERVVEWVDTQVDIKKFITELVLLARARMEQVFDAIQQNPTSTKPDYVLLKYFETLFLACEKFDRIVNNSPDQIIQHNYTVQVMEQNVAIFQEAVRKTLAQMDTEASLQFVEILNEELAKLKRPEEVVTGKDEAQLLKDMTTKALME